MLFIIASKIIKYFLTLESMDIQAAGQRCGAFVYLFVFCNTGIELRTSHLLDKQAFEPHSQPFCFQFVFQIGSCDNFAHGWPQSLILCLLNS
jgi:hypothetical protein